LPRRIPFEAGYRIEENQIRREMVCIVEKLERIGMIGMSQESHWRMPEGGNYDLLRVDTNQLTL